MHILPIPCTKLWGSKYIPWSKFSRWGFYIMQLEKVAMILCHLQTMEMWVLAWIMGIGMVPLMHLGVWGIPNLGLVSTKDLVILLGLLFVWSRHTSKLTEVRFSCVLAALWFVCFLISAFILLIVRFLSGCKWHGWCGASWLKASQPVHGWCHKVHHKPVKQTCACHLLSLWVGLSFISSLGWGFYYGVFVFPSGLGLQSLGL